MKVANTIMKDKYMFKRIESSIDAGLDELSMIVKETDNMTLQGALLDLLGEWCKFQTYLTTSGYEGNWQIKDLDKHYK
jgi:hypothetical protein